MGNVYLAIRADDQYRKRVAIKLIKRGMDTDTILRRFVMERQILANLEHPNIAQLLDGGTTTDGLPYFVMEYIEGQPITRYCDERRLTTAERLELFRHVCSALQYAHQHLVVHRDIKPSNIMVTAEGAPKLLDFGIAKLLTPNWATETDDATLSMMQVMTPEYASPEQLRGQPITTASDVYSLGVVLYELLSGHRPYRLTSRQPEEMARVILQDEPLKPSAAVTITNESCRTEDDQAIRITPKSVGRTREGTVEKLRRRLSGDLDNIVLKSLRKEPPRRYASVQEFSEDIRRHLEGLPVSAGPDTLGYRARKFTQRHNAGVLAAAVVVIALFAATAITTWQARVAKLERDKAERRFNDVRKLTNSFMFEFHDSIRDLSGSTPARELVVRKALEYLDVLAREDAGDCSLRYELAVAYAKVGDIQGRPLDANLGDTKGALENYRKSADILEALYKSDSSNQQYRKQLANTHMEIAAVNQVIGEIEAALKNNQRALTLLEEQVAVDTTDIPAKLSLAHSYKGVGDITAAKGNLEDAVRNYRKGLEMSEAILAKHREDIPAKRMLMTAYDAIGTTLGNPNYTNLGDAAGALEVYRKLLKVSAELLNADQTSYFNQHSQAYTLKNIGEVLTVTGDWNAALENYRQAIAIQQRLVQADPQDVFANANLAYMLTDMGEALAETKRVASALEQHRKAIEIVSKLSAADKENSLLNTHLTRSYQIYGDALLKAGDVDAALEFYNKALASDAEMAKKEPNNMDISPALAKGHSKISEAQITLATNAMTSLPRQLELWQAARKHFGQSQDVYLDMQNHNLRTKPINDALNGVMREIVRCDEALAKIRLRATSPSSLKAGTR